jgi:DNA segregation ATPase FtsK/SpoIIIE, S-DNA-T family
MSEPQSSRVHVLLREILASEEFRASKAELPLAIGKDVYGKTLIADLAAMPHLLVAGVAGSGKTMCMNAIALSLLAKYSSSDLRLILIKPDILDSNYLEPQPHLLFPPVYRLDLALAALKWVIGEIESREKLLFWYGVPTISDFNSGSWRTSKSMARSEFSLVVLKEPSKPERVPYIVVFIDELADLLQSDTWDLEPAIIHIAKRAHQVGIHPQ